MPWLQPFVEKRRACEASDVLLFYAPVRGALIMGFLAAIMTVIIQQALATLLEHSGLLLMTLPFCATALPFIILQGATTLVIAVPLATMTCLEGHLKRVKTLTDGFKLLKEVIRPTNDQSSYTLVVEVRKHLSVLSEEIAESSQVMNTSTKATSSAANIKRCSIVVSTNTQPWSFVGPVDCRVRTETSTSSDISSICAPDGALASLMRYIEVKVPHSCYDSGSQAYVFLLSELENRVTNPTSTPIWCTRLKGIYET
jgi:hypothetical protein